jgi:hypothetical protein
VAGELAARISIANGGAGTGTGAGAPANEPVLVIR